MVQIPVVNNYKQYLVTDKGIEVIYNDGKQECLVANRTIKQFFIGNNLSLSDDGKIIKNNKKKKVNVKPKPKNKPVQSAIKAKPKATPKAVPVVPTKAK